MEYYNTETNIRPIIPLRGMTVFPNMVVHFDVSREKSIEALEQASLDNSKIFLTTQYEALVENPREDDFYHYGVVAVIKQMVRLSGGITRVLVEGLNRGRIVEFTDNSKCFTGVIEEYIYDSGDFEITTEIEAKTRLIKESFSEYVSLNDRILPEELLTIEEIKDPSRVTDLIASLINLDTENAQKIIETLDIETRMDILYVLFNEEIEILEIKSGIEQKVNEHMQEVQKEYYLKEQMKIIRDELGDTEDIDDEVNEYIEKIKALDLDEESEQKVIKEAERLLKMSPYSQEVGIIRTYLDWIIDLPWNKLKESEIDINKAKEILNKDHYGLEDVKERVLEFIAVKKLTEKLEGPILCLVGPPGVGKTSIAKSIARALDKDFVRMSLGGVRDEAEIRGHRRTYVGAMPGKIISSLSKAGSSNPVFLLDEIDKIGSDFRGDPASGLLEVLDPEQNINFMDHFLDIPYDLSKVIFLTTANTTSTIPPALLDRMEVIEIGSYIEEEKLQIAKRYLLPKQIKAHGLKEENLQVSEGALLDIINYYTREAGVRNLEREIANICRKAAKRIVEEDIKTVRVNVNSLKNYLGNKKYRQEVLEKENEIGLVNGLAWTPVGGATLNIEVSIMTGKNKMHLTGQLGDIMKESAMAALTFARSYVDTKENYSLDGKDIHIHVPEGAIPKDGPSAGIAISTAIISKLTDTPVDRNIAMTGEVTIRGKVLPVGGIKEKVLAGERLGVKKIILPKDNESDLDDIPKDIKNRLEFILVEDMKEVLELALIKDDTK